MKQWQTKTKRTISSAAFLCAVIAVILLFNIVLGAAAEKIQLRWDLTENKLYALTQETKNVLASLQEDITVYYFVSAGQESGSVVRTLDMYRTACAKLHFVESDPNTDPVSARRFTDKGITLAQNTIILERGGRYKVITPQEMYGNYTTQSGETLEQAYFNLEQLMTRAIAYVASDNTKKIFFTIGHNELDYSAVLTTLQNENIEVYQINLQAEDVPAEADALYILAPGEDFTADEVLKLDAFLQAGKGVQVCFDARKKVLPTLEQYLTDFWGVTMYHDLVCEGDASKTLNYSYMFFPKVYAHPATETIAAGNQNVVWMYARSLSLTETEGIDSQLLASASDAAFSVHGSDRNVTEHIRDGALPLAAALTRTERSGIESRMVVSGAYQVYDAFFLEESALANSDFLYGITRYLDKDDTAALSVSPKSLLLRTILISDSMTTFYIIVICILPSLFIFVLGFITFRRRRHL